MINKNLKKNDSLSQLESLQVFSVDYEKVKVMIKAYHELYSKLVGNRNTNHIYTNNFVLKITLTIL